MREVDAAAHLFDGDILVAIARRFLSDENNQLVLAYLDARPVGFVSGVETTHPDKGTEMFLYELSVEER